MNWAKLADDATIQKTISALAENGIEAEVVESKKAALTRLLELIPQGSEVMTMSSLTLEAIGALPKLNDSKKFDSIKNKLMSMNRKTQEKEMNRLGAVPEYVVGSVQAVTQDGKILIASNTGSQLGAYAYSAKKVVWVVGAQKIVKNMDEAMKRIYEHAFPLEDARAKKVYGFGSGVNKILVVNKERQPGRISLIFVKEVLGF